MDWFTADHHFNHNNVRLYCARPFATTEDMNEELIIRWNTLIKDSDRVFHLGDFAFGKQEQVIQIVSQLNGQKFLIKGNHDHRKVYAKADVLKYFGWLKDYYELKVKDEEMDCTQLIVLCHYPIASWNKMHHGSWALHGHSHGSLPQSDSLARMDVGVDANNWQPVSYDQIRVCMTRKIFKPVDHHGVQGIL